VYMSSTENRKIYRSIAEPLRTGLSWREMWLGPDNGLVYCWERGRQLIIESPESFERVSRGELIPLWWRGGVQKALKNPTMPKDGTHQYLATWLGMRQQDLEIDLDQSYCLTCSRTGQVVEFSPFSKWKDEPDREVSESEVLDASSFHHG